MGEGLALNGSARREAIELWQAEAAGGVLLSGAELARRYGRSSSWGRQVAREARATGGPMLPTAAAVPVPAVDVPAPGDRLSVEMPPAAAPVAPPTAVPVAPVDDAGAPAAVPVPGWVRAASVVAVAVVALAAAVASVDHLAAVARAAGTGSWKVWLLPAAVDGLAVAGALTLYTAHLARQASGVLPWVALLGGLAASVAGNVIAVHPELVPVAWLKIGVGATPPLTLAVSVELALRQVRQARR